MKLSKTLPFLALLYPTTLVPEGKTRDGESHLGMAGCPPDPQHHLLLLLSLCNPLDPHGQPALK